MPERREFTRVPAETQVNVRPVSEGETKRGRGRNIGGGGILFSSPVRFEPGALLDIEVLTATHRDFAHAFEPLRARVRVVRVEGEQAPFDVAAVFVKVGG